MARLKPGSAPRRAEWARIRLFAMDVDGVLTDGSVIVFSDGTEAKRFSVLDGMGLGMVRDAGFEIAWISGRSSGATTKSSSDRDATGFQVSGITVVDYTPSRLGAQAKWQRASG